MSICIGASCLLEHEHLCDHREINPDFGATELEITFEILKVAFGSMVCSTTLSVRRCLWYDMCSNVFERIAAFVSHFQPSGTSKRVYGGRVLPNRVFVTLSDVTRVIGVVLQSFGRLFNDPDLSKRIRHKIKQQFFLRVPI